MTFKSLAQLGFDERMQKHFMQDMLMALLQKMGGFATIDVAALDNAGKYQVELVAFASSGKEGDIPDKFKLQLCEKPTSASSI